MCYSNIYLIRNCAELRNYSYKIAYGYLLDSENIYTRHCFILLADNTVVDPTIFVFTTPEDVVEYFIIKSFNLMEYSKEIIHNEYDLSLGYLLIGEEIEVHDKLKKYGYERNVYENDEFLLRRLKNIDMQI